MKIQSLFLFFAGLLVPALALAQDVSKLYGIVTNEKEERLIGATVYWADTKIGTITDTEGQFWLPKRSNEGVIIVKYVGYEPAEIPVLTGEDSLWIEVAGVAVLQEVTVSERSFDNKVSTLSTRNIETIGGRELRKAPC